MSAIDRFATLVSDPPRDYALAALRLARHALIAVVACQGATNPPAAMATWIDKPWLCR